MLSVIHGSDLTTSIDISFLSPKMMVVEGSLLLIGTGHRYGFLCVLFGMLWPSIRS